MKKETEKERGERKTERTYWNGENCLWKQYDKNPERVKKIHTLGIPVGNMCHHELTSFIFPRFLN